MSDSLIIVQARMGSSRLPGKTMMEIGGTPLLGYLINSLETVSKKDSIVVATSIGDENEPIRSYCSKIGINCFSGSELDVASRFYSILQEYQPQYFHRICGDTPFYDQNLITQGNFQIQKEELDFVSSMPNKGYPMGCNMEVFDTKFYLDYIVSETNLAAREHVTAGIYQNLERFRYKLVTCPLENFNYSQFKFSVDTPEDFVMAQSMLEKMDYCPWNYTFLEKIQIQNQIKQCL